MIAHVAEQGEARGRVVLQLGSGEPSVLALEAAVRVAQAFNSEIESLFVESQELLQLASYPFAKEISLTGRRARAISCAEIERDMRYASQSLHRRLERMARAVEVTVRRRVVRADPAAAVAQACAESGPWNVIALGEAFGLHTRLSPVELLATVADATGLILVGPRAVRTRGPVVIAVDDAQRLADMLHAAERLAPITGGDIIVLLLGLDEEHGALLETQVRLLIGDRADVRLMMAELAHGETAVIAETLRRLRGGFVIATLGGATLSEPGDLRQLATALECPLFLVR